MQLLIGLVPALFWGIMGFVSNRMGGKAGQVNTGMMLGATLTAIIITGYFKPSINLELVGTGAISGGLLAISTFALFAAYQEIGVSKTTPIVVAGQLSFNVLSGAILFSEWSSISSWALGIFSILLVILGAFFTTYLEKGKNRIQKPVFSRKVIILLAVNVITTFGYSVIPKYFQVLNTSLSDFDIAYGLMLPQAVGGLIASVFICLSVTKMTFRDMIFDRAIYGNMLTGLIWMMGNLAMFVTATGPLGLSIAYTLSQMNIIIGTLSGIYLLHEQKTRKELFYALLGISLVFIGGVLATFT